MTTIDPSKIGMSDLSTLVGLNPYAAPIDLWQRLKGLAPPQEATLLMDLGHHMEPFLVRRWELATGGKSRGPKNLKLKHSFLRANLDADAELNGVPVVVDGKSSGHRMAGHWGDGEDEVPRWMIPQMQGYLWATGYPLCNVAAIIGGSDFKVYTIRPDAELQEALIDAACRFWRDHVETGKPPPPDGSKSYSSYLREAYPKHERPMLPSTMETDLLASTYREALRKKEAAEHEAEEAKTRLMALLADAEGIQGAGYKITYRANKDSTRTDWKELAQALKPSPELIEQFTTTTPGARVFRFTTGGKS